MNRFWIPGLIVWFLAAGLGASGCNGCGGEGSDAGSDAGLLDAGTDAAAGPTTVLFRPAAAPGDPPAFGDVPFPDDLYLTDADGTVVDDLPGLGRIAGANQQLLANGLGVLDGFGRTTAILFFTQGAVSAASLGGNFALVDVDPASPTLGVELPAVAMVLPSLDCVSVLPEPGVVLPEGTLHAVVLRSGLETPSGDAVLADAELVRIASLAAGDRSSTAELTHGGALDALVSAGHLAAPAEAVGLAVFTTQVATDDMLAMRADLLDPAVTPPPQLITDPLAAAPFGVAVFGTATTPSLTDWLGVPDTDPMGVEWPGLDNPSGAIAHDAIGAVVSGAFPAPSFLDSGDHFVYGPAGAPIIVDPDELAPVTFIFPVTPPPPTGYPVIVSGHGIGSDRVMLFSEANELARAGFVTVGMDYFAHGIRGGGVDTGNGFSGTYTGPDTLSDTASNPLGLFGLFDDMIAIRDRFRQIIVDHFSLIRLVREPGLDLSLVATATGGAVPTLDPDNVFYAGQSLGGMMGTGITALEPAVRGASLTVPGGGFSHILAPASANLHGAVGLVTISLAAAGNEPFSAFHPIAAILATVMEPGDPLSYAPFLVGDTLIIDGAPRPDANVLVTYAIDDETMPNVATHALIRAMGIPLVDPFLIAVADVPVEVAPLVGNMGAATAGAVQFAPATHGLGNFVDDIREFVPGHPMVGEAKLFPELASAITIELPIREHAAALVTFFTTALAGAPAEIIVTLPPVADFDNDGVLDDDEVAAGTDPYDPASN